MLGHPGISAFEYAGEAQRHLQEKRVIEVDRGEILFRRAWRDSTQSSQTGGDDAILPVLGSSKKTADISQPPRTPVEECNIAQRRRGTFMNHTPREHEVRSTTKSSPRPTSEEELGHVYEAGRASEDEITRISGGRSPRCSSYGSFGVDQNVRSRMNASGQMDGTGMMLNPLVMHPTSPVSTSRPRRSRSSSVTASIKSTQTGIGKRSFKKLLSGNAAFDETLYNRSASFEEPGTTAGRLSQRGQPANSKRRRRQTPYAIPKPIVTDFGRHAPLEPLVAHYRREVTGSDVDPLPPHVDIDNDISEAATLLAINEYFSNQGPLQPVDSSMELHNQVKPTRSKTSTAEVLSPTSFRSSCCGHSSSKHDLSHSRDSCPNLPERNPERLSRINTPTTPLRIHSTSQLSSQSDFTSAAKGTYSPYIDEPHHDTIHELPAEVPPAHDRSTSAALDIVKLAPPIPGHDELANARLNDFNYFLRFTGPPPHIEQSTTYASEKRRKRLRAMRVRGKKESNNVNSSSTAALEQFTANTTSTSLPPLIPACAREMTTSSGAKHLQIVIPQSTSADDDTHAGADFTWTDEMSQPLASAAVERAINPRSSYTSSPPLSPAARAASSGTTVRHPRPTAVAPAAVRVDEHPLLLSRAETTRTRKLRDLQRAKAKVGESEVEAASVRERMARLEWLAEQLAEGLARSAGMEVAGGEVEPEAVLRQWKGSMGGEE